MMRKSTKAKSIFTALAFAMLSTAVLTACSDSPRKESGSTDTKTEETADKASDDVNFDTYVDQVSELVKLNWPAMDKVWPGYDYTNHNFLIFYLNEEGAVKEAKFLNVNENRSLEKSEYEGITPRIRRAMIS